MPRKNCSVRENWLIIYEMTRGRENLISKGYLLIKFPKQKTYINNYAQPLYSRSLSALKNGSVYAKALSLEYSIGSPHCRGYVRGKLMSNISFMISRNFEEKKLTQITVLPDQDVVKENQSITYLRT